MATVYFLKVLERRVCNKNQIKKKNSSGFRKRCEFAKSFKNLKVGNDKEMAQSERNSHSIYCGG